MLKKLNGDPLVSSGIVCYAEKRNNFYSSIPRPMVKFDTLNFRRIL